jgi:hypothetical protein
LFDSAARLQEQRLQLLESVLGSSIDENFFVAWKLNTIEEWRVKNIVCFSEEIIGTNATRPKSVLVSCTGEDVRFR